MPDVSSEELKRAKRTADRYISRSGGTPSPQACGVDERGLELAQQKHKIRRQRDEIAKLKRTIKMLRDKLKDFAA